MTGSYTQTGDALEHLGRVAAWLKSAPAAEHSYGWFNVGRVEVVFEGEVIGAFISDGDTWMFESSPNPDAL